MNYKLLAIVGLWACAGAVATAQQKKEIQPAQATISVNDAIATGHPPEGTALVLDDVFAAWERIASEHTTALISWQRVDATMPISRFHAEYTDSPSVEPNGHQLQLDGTQLRFLSQRIFVAQIERPDDSQIHREVFNYLPERYISPFATLLHSHFTLPAPTVVTQPFVRYSNHGHIQDFWSEQGELYPRAVSHTAPAYSSDDWALMRIEEEDNDQCASLDLWTALIALRPSGLPPFEVQRDHCKLDAQPVITNGHECLRVIERLNPSGPSRVWFVDSQTPHVVRRYVGITAKAGVQLDLSWSSLGGRWRPQGWKYCHYKRNQAPPQFFGESLVVSEEDVSVQAVVKECASFSTANAITATFDSKAFPIGTWVIDEVSDEQYIVAENGQPRLITPAELAWLPLHSELMQTSTGKVADLIESKMVWRKVRRGEWNVPLGIAAVLFLGAVAVGLRRLWQRERQKVGRDNESVIEDMRVS